LLAANNDHWQYDIPVLAAHIHIAQHVISDSPDEVGSIGSIWLFVAEVVSKVNYICWRVALKWM
jgi:hypothetical protein